MFIFLGKYKNIIIFVCLCTVSLIISWLTVGSIRTIESTAHASNSPFKSKFSVFFVPIHFCSSIISSISAKFAHLGSIFTSICQKPLEKAQFQNLKNEVENLKYLLDVEKDRNRRLTELYEVYADLNEAAGLKPATNFRLVPANVIAVEPTDWFRYLTIDKGTKSGVKVDMAVITRSNSLIGTPYLTGTIVGRIAEVQLHSAKVQLITDRLSVAAVSIESLGDLVLLRGQPENENCVIDEIPSTTHDILKKGDAVISDERSYIFPPGMLIGKISSIKKGLRFCRIEVQPYFKFNKLREVMVVLDD